MDALWSTRTSQDSTEQRSDRGVRTAGRRFSSPFSGRRPSAAAPRSDQPGGRERGRAPSNGHSASVSSFARTLRQHWLNDRSACDRFGRHARTARRRDQQQRQQRQCLPAVASAAACSTLLRVTACGHLRRSAGIARFVITTAHSACAQPSVRCGAHSLTLTPPLCSCVVCAICTENNQGCMVLSLEWSDAAPSTSTSTSGGASAPSAPLRRIYVGWLGDAVPRDPNGGSHGMGAIGLPALFAQSLGLVDGVRIHVQLVPDRMVASLSAGGAAVSSSSSAGGPSSLGGASKDLVCLEPLTTDEWEILELNAGAVEMGLLAQIQVLNPGQTFPLWIGAGSGRSNAPGSGGVCIRMKQTPAGGQGKDLLGGKSSAAAAAAASVPFFKLTLNSEVSIVPKPRSSKRAGASSQQAVVPAGPPPPVAKLRVQPWQAGAIGREVARQRREQREQARLERLRIQECKVREWEEHRGIDLARPLLPLDSLASFNAAADHSPSVCTLTSSHYVHVSAATMRYLQVEPHALVVISFVRKVPGGKAAFPAPPSPPTIETHTSVVRIAESPCVFEGTINSAAAPASFAASAPHHILLPPALRLAFHVSDFAWVHVQKLTAASSLSATSPLAQRLRVQESTQRLQSIRLREMRVLPQMRDHSTRSSNKRGALSVQSALLAPSQRPASLSPADEEQDARNVSQAFLDYVRSSCSDAARPDVPLPLPLVNGAFIALIVPAVGPSFHGAPANQRRFFSVHFNEVELLKGAAAAGGGASGADPDGAPDSATVASSSSGGIKVSMATSYFLLRHPDAGCADSAALVVAETGKKKSKKKQAAAVAPLPTPVINQLAQPVALELDEFEDGWDQVDDALIGDVGGDADSGLLSEHDALAVAGLAPPESSAPLALDELGGGPEFHKTVVQPVWRFLKNSLCSEFIQARADLVQRGGAQESLSDALVPAVSSASLSSRVPTAPVSSIGGLMLVGASRGCGKSALLRSMCRKLCFPNREVGVLAHTIWVDCKEKGSEKVRPHCQRHKQCVAVGRTCFVCLLAFQRALMSSFGNTDCCFMLYVACFVSSIQLSDLRAWLHRVLFKEVLSAAPGAVVIVLDDLDKLLPAPAGDNDGGAGLRVTQQAEILYDGLTSFQAQHPRVPLALLSICGSTSSHHPLCNLLFPHVVAMANPSAADRQDMLTKIVVALSRQAAAPNVGGRSAPVVKLSRKVELAAIARRTEGYTVSDLKQLVTRVLHAALTRTMQQAAAAPTAAVAPTSSTALEAFVPSGTTSPASTFLLTPADFDTAFRGFVPSALKELALNDDSGTDAGASDASPTAGWESVGGLFSLKRTLLDTLELPTRYAMLFAAAPLKLRSGLLIYGPPGCGSDTCTHTHCNRLLRVRSSIHSIRCSSRFSITHLLYL